RAFVLDLDEDLVNPELVQLRATPPEFADELRDLVRRHLEETGSGVAADLLDDWERGLARLTEIVPTNYLHVLRARADAQQAGLDADGTTAAMMEAANG